MNIPLYTKTRIRAHEHLRSTVKNSVAVDNRGLRFRLRYHLCQFTVTGIGPFSCSTAIHCSRAWPARCSNFSYQ